MSFLNLEQLRFEGMSYEFVGEEHGAVSAPGRSTEWLSRLMRVDRFVELRPLQWLWRTPTPYDIENRAKATATEVERDLPATLVKKRIAFCGAF